MKSKVNYYQMDKNNEKICNILKNKIKRKKRKIIKKSGKNDIS